MADIDKMYRALANADKAADAGDQQAAVEAKQIANAIKQMQADAQPKTGMYENVRNTLTDANEGIKQGLFLGAGDEIMAGLMTPIEMGAQAIRGDDVSMSGAYNTNLGRERDALHTAQERSPIASAVGNIAGGVMTAGGLQKGGVSLMNAAKPTVASMAGRGALEGAAYGGVQGFNAGEGGVKNRLKEAAWGAGIGGATGGAIGAVGGKFAQRSANKTVSTIENIKANKDLAYIAVDRSGFKYTPDEVDDLIRGLNIVSNENKINQISEIRHPFANSILKEINKFRGQQLTLSDVDKIRQAVSSEVVKSGTPAEQRIGMRMINSIDDFINSKPGNELINKARALNTKLSKAETLGLQMSKAQRRASGSGSGGNIENATRQKVTQLLENPKMSKGFSKAEMDAMDALIAGGTMQNFLRKVGKLSPDGNGLGLWSLLFGGVAAGATGNPLMLAGSAAGLGSKFASERMANNAVKNLDVLIRNGGVMPKPALSPVAKGLFDVAIREGARQTGRATKPLRVDVGVGGLK